MFKRKEKFPYDIDLGAIMDYVKDHFILVIKDDFWTEEEIKLLQNPLDLHFCYTMDIAIFVLEGGSIDSSDFYFNIQECDWKEHLLNSRFIDVELLLVDKHNDICFKRKKTLNEQQSQNILTYLKKQNEVQFMPNEYDVNIQGLQSSYEPFELLKYAKEEIKF
ncbi:MAG: hypothetical protein HUJ53_03950 [Holdemanella sp.]|nr:hypothetical protein [Holdemanella sp.]